jgi:hypothetical protein
MVESQLAGELVGDVMEMLRHAVDYQPPPTPKEKEPKVALNLRVEVSLRRQLEALVSLWNAHAIARGEFGKWDLTEVVKHLLGVGIDGAFAQTYRAAGLSKMPANEAEWAIFRAALEKQLTEMAELIATTPGARPSPAGKSRR